MRISVVLMRLAKRNNWFESGVSNTKLDKSSIHVRTLPPVVADVGFEGWSGESELSQKLVKLTTPFHPLA